MPAKGGSVQVGNEPVGNEPVGTDVVVLAGGQPVDPALRRMVEGAEAVIAADSGVGQATLLGLHVDLVVGDLDSASAADLDAAIAAGAVVERHPAAKDATDLELALDAAVRLGARRTVVLGIDGGPRLDHLLGNLLLLATPRYAPLGIVAVAGTARVTPVHAGAEPATLSGEPGSVVSLLALGGTARGVTTSGLVYPLSGEDLLPGSTRGVSNEMVGGAATVALRAGVLLAVQPFDGEA
jgi:thiamine pyrophosphokinase